MRHARLLVVVLVGALAAAAWWLLDSRATDAVDGASGVAALDPERDSAALRAGGDAEGDEEQATATERTALTVGNAPAAGEGAGPFGYVGHVVDAAGQPVAGATVYLTPWPVASWSGVDAKSATDPDRWAETLRKTIAARVTGQTAADGTFRIPAPAVKGVSCGVRVTARGHQVLNQTVPPLRGADYDLGTLRLAAGAVVSGRVVDPAGRPVAGARVLTETRGLSTQDLDDPAGPEFDELGPPGSARSDREGRFELPYAAPGEFTVSARHPDYPTGRRTGLRVAPGGTLHDVVITLEPAAEIRGRIVGMPKGVRLRVLAAPMQDRRQNPVVYGPETGFAERGAAPDADGAFTIRGLCAAADYRVWAAHLGPAFGARTVCSEALVARSGAEGITLHYDAGVTVTFRVVDRRGAPIERVFVTHTLASSDPQSSSFNVAPTQTRLRYEGGKVTLANLRPKERQTLSLIVEAVGCRKVERNGIELPVRGNLDLGTITLEPAPTVRVLVTSADGQPVAGATVRVQPEDDRRGSGQEATERTDAEGRCVVNGIEQGAMHVVVQADGFARYRSAPFALAADGQAEHHARLVRGGTVVVEVVDADGNPVPRASVTHREPDGALDHVTTDGKGRLCLVHLMPGKHAFRISGMSYARMANGLILAQEGRDGAAWTEVEVCEGAQEEVRLVEEPTAVLIGVVRENGMPLANAEMSWSARGRSGRGPRTDESGRYRLEGVALGDVELHVRHGDRAMPASVPATVAVGTNVIDIDLDVTSIRGTVTDPDGKPIAGAAVWVRGTQQPWQAPRLGGGDRGEESTQTDREGRYRLRGVVPGVEIVAVARAPGYAMGESEPVTPARGSDHDGVDVRLPAAGKIRVRADVKGWAMAEVRDAQNVVWHRQSLQRGEAVVDGVLPGRWFVTLRKSGGRFTPPREVEVRAGATADVSF